MENNDKDYLYEWVTVHSDKEWEEIEKKAKRQLQREFLEDTNPEIIHELRAQYHDAPEGCAPEDFFAWPGVVYGATFDPYCCSWPARVLFVPHVDVMRFDTGKLYTMMSLTIVMEPDAKKII